MMDEIDRKYYKARAEFARAKEAAATNSAIANMYRNIAERYEAEAETAGDSRIKRSSEHF